MNQFNQRAKSVPLFFIIIIIFIFRVNHAAAKIPPTFSAEKAGFSIKFKNEISPYRVMGVFVLPDEIVTLEVIDSEKIQTYQIKISSGALNQINTKKWQWRAPAQKGLYPMTIAKDGSSASITLNVFVMVLFKEVQGEYLNCYRIGEYPKKPLKDLPIYQPPPGFIEVTPEIQETLISPHFKLNQFLCKQGCDSAKYLILEERLILKLELILEKVNETGHACNTFHIMSGYRTPHYNQAIGNVKYSRHCWGGAADIFIDENPKDDMMDDLNNDSKIDLKDAKILYDIIDEICGKPENEMFIGGLGKYKKTASHGPFVHVDVRGYRARWGD
ncbi:D-Ala-D-Ala carboxypeptidase family metallohydrolase [candidate division KSB1 bacterium]|nr:D-Ala-D-Ala carboxypeptidase family metallohydrolase [candidate division KSB1 bacterium]